MDFSEAEAYLFSLGNEVETMKLGLENIRTLLEALGRPQDKYLKVQVAGTNGKGSVCAFLDSICFQAGIQTGLYTSPHLISITERIKIGSADIKEEEFAGLATRVRAVSENLVANGDLESVPTFFEQATAIALLAFAEAKVKLAILETGLGGRCDAVTAAEAEIAVITRIDLDHQEYLGETIEEIAAEKAAIIRENTLDVVLGEQNAVALQVILDRCREMQIVPSNETFEPWSVVDGGPETVKAILSGQVFDNIRLGLKGRHQAENALTAVRAARCLQYSNGIGIEEGAIAAGLENARHPGRLEYIGKFLLDGAHNPSGARVLSTYLDEFVDRPFTMIFGAMRDKDVREIAEILWAKVEKLIFTRPANSRAMDTDELLRVVPASVDRDNVVLAENTEDAVHVARTISNDGTILVTGSLYLVGEVRKILKDQPAI